MPREIVHWVVLERAMKGRISRKLVSAFEDCGDAAAIGAVVHDAPFYHHWGRGAFSAAAEALHGTHGEDTFLPLRLFIEEADRSATKREHEILRQFLLGMLSHYVTDTVFHPLVYYFTGDYYHPEKEIRREARTRHHLFEVHLDSSFRYHSPPSSRRCFERIAELVKRSPDVVRIATGVLNALPKPYGSPVWGKDLWGESLRSMALLQSLFLSRAAGLCARVVRRLIGNSLSAEAALFSCRRSQPEPLFEHALQWRNPVTGEFHTDSVFELRDRAVSELLGIVEVIEPYFTEGDSKKALDFFSEHRGLSLNYGVEGARASEAVFFAKEVERPDWLGGCMP